MRILLPLIFASICTHSAAAVPKNFYGKWNLIELQCKNKKISQLGQRTNEELSSGRREELYVVSQEKVEYRFIERYFPEKSSAFCETAYSQKWNVHGDMIEIQEMTFLKREGKDGYNCPEPFDRNPQKNISPMRFKLQGKQLTLIRKNRGECESGKNVSHIFRHTD
jgi:hypothetical protein